jgi:hypothetical protein
VVDGMRFLPRPLQRPGVPVCVAGFYGKAGPLRRAARHDGFFPINVEHPDQLAESVAGITGCAGTWGGPPPSHTTSLPPYRPAAIRRPTPRRGLPGGWWSSPWEVVSVDQVRGVIRDGPAASP